MHKIVVTEIPQIKGIDVFGIKTLVHGNDQFPEGIGKQILGIFILKHTELGHPGPDDGHASAELPVLFHSNCLPILQLLLVFEGEKFVIPF
jgi:hypothetical protein